MGFYINPPTLTKEAWLDQNGKQLTEAPVWKDIPFDSLPVCLVDNTMFTAAGIAYDEGEFNDFMSPDRRRKIWFIVPKEKILEVEPSIKHLIKLPKKA
jgi:hypothetical protein